MPSGSCHRCKVERRWLHKHHVKLRCDGGTDADGIEWVCANCHEDVHDGPMGGKSTQHKRHTPEAEAKRADAMRKQWADPAFRAKMVEKRQQQFTPEVRARMAEATKRALNDRPDEVKEAHRLKAAAARKGKGSEASSRAKREWWANATDEQRAQYREKRRSAAVARRAPKP